MIHPLPAPLIISLSSRPVARHFALNCNDPHRSDLAPRHARWSASHLKTRPLKLLTLFACFAAVTGFSAAIGVRSPSEAEVLTNLVQEAEALHALRPLSVLDKKLTAASGDKHDFFAIGKLAWANPASPDGLPWVRRDGAHNPAAFSSDYDKAHYNATLERIHVLALAWHHTRDERHAAKAVSLIRAWFLDPVTRMNPHFQYAAALPGVHAGMPIGIIEGVVLIEFIEDLKLLAGCASLTAADEVALKRWFADYTAWLLDSEFGKEEARATSNHAVWYAAQVATFSLFTGDKRPLGPMIDIGRRILDNNQNEEGGFPVELGRRQSQHYSVYMLAAYIALARCGEQSGIPAHDLWHYESPRGRSLRRGLAWITPYLANEKPWPFPDMDRDAGKPPLAQAMVVLRQASRIWPDLAPGFERAAAQVFQAQPASVRAHWLLTPTDR